MTPYLVPVVSASVYGQRQHDLLLDAFVRPFWQTSELKGEGGFLWTMRYGGGGEHLKLRFHGPERCVAETRQALATVFDRFLAALPEEDPQPVVAGPLPPIDPEDEEEGVRPSRFWRWTTFRPSPFVFGAERLAADPQLVALHAHAQSAVAEIVMGEVSTNWLEPRFATLRQSLFIRVLVASLATVGFSPPERVAYLRHHRDWLVRFLIVKARSGEVSGDTVLEPLRRRIATLDSTVEAIRLRLDAPADATATFPELLLWQERLAAFFAYVVRFRGDPAYHLDPYTDDTAHLPLFKLLHGASNQFGMPLSQELYVYELLLTAAERSSA